MTIHSWATGVNNKAYGQSSQFVDNKETVELKSGRKIYYLKNSAARKTHSVVMRFDDDAIVSDSKTEFELFIYWWETEIKSGTEPFYFPDITLKDGTTNRAYYMSDNPAYAGQKTKEVKFTLEDA